MTSDPGDLGPWLKKAIRAIFGVAHEDQELVDRLLSDLDVLDVSVAKNIRRVALALKGAADEQRERDAALCDRFAHEIRFNPGGLPYSATHIENMGAAIRGAARIRSGGNQNEDGE